MKEFSAGIDIEATPEAVWGVLVDTANWPAFDPNCERIEGRVALGETVTAYSKLAPGRAFPVTVTTLDQPTRMEWSHNLPLGLLKSVRTQTITPRGTGSRLEVSEVMSGPMLRVIGGLLPDLDEAFAAFCRGLKERVDAQPG